MSDRAFDAARDALSSAHETDGDLCAPFLQVVPATGAAVSVLAGTKGQSTVCASDATASRLDELQFDLGEGPCWTALATRMPLIAGLGPAAEARWPIFTDAVRADALGGAVASMFALPLAIGQIEIGAIDLYSTSSAGFDLERVSELTDLARIAAFQVLRRILADGESDADDEQSVSSGSRREVHQATGMILMQLDVSADDAALLLRAKAYSTGRSVREVASDVVSRRLDFSTETA